MAYEELLSYKYLLAFRTEAGRFEFTNADPRAKDINRISLNLRRNESSTLSIMFTDPMLEWTKYFAIKESVKVYFKGENLDGSAPEEFIGWASQVIPHSSGRVQQIEVIFLDCPPSLFRPAQVSKTYKKMTRRAIVQKLCADTKNKLICIDKNPLLDKVEDELTHSVNESIAQFLTKMMTDIGSCINFFHLNWWVVPKISTSSAKHVHSNQGVDGSLLEMSPTFVPFMFEDKETKASDKDKNKQAIDPTTKKVEDQGTKGDPTNAPTKGGSSGISQMIYDTIQSQWAKKN